MIDPRDTEFADQDAEAWWGERGAKLRVAERVQRLIAERRQHRNLALEDMQARQRASWQRLNARFDPPLDDYSISQRLHVPYSGRRPVPWTTWLSNRWKWVSRFLQRQENEQ